MKNDPAALGAATVQLSICYQHLASRLNQELKAVDLNMTQISILTHFSRHPERPKTVSGLAAVMEMNQPAVTKAVKSLETKGWLQRQADEDDARVAHIQVTEAGLAQLSKAQRACGPVISQSFSDFSPEELSQFHALLNKLKNRVTSAIN